MRFSNSLASTFTLIAISLNPEDLRMAPRKFMGVPILELNVEGNLPPSGNQPVP